MNLVPKRGEHLAIVGQTGSGKSTSAVQILIPLTHSGPVTIVDSKGDDVLESVTSNIITDIRKGLAAHKRGQTFIYRPDGIWNDARQLDWFLQCIYNQRRSGTVYVDEGYQVCPTSARPGIGYGNLLMRGRYRKTRKDTRPVEVSIITSIQRPVWVPKQIFTEANKFMVHSIMRDDLKRMVEYVGDEDLLKNPPDFGSHEFWFYDLKEQFKRKVRFTL